MHNKETRRKISEALRGKPKSEEHKKKLSNALRGKIPIGFLKIKGWNRGKKLSKEHCKNISLAKKGTNFGHKFLKGHKSGMTGHKHLEESKRKMSEAKRKNPIKSTLGKHLSLETKQKISIANKGQKRSSEARKRMSEAQKGEKSHQWRGGTSFEPYTIDWTKTLKRSIRERDHYTCQICGKELAICIHHIDYNKLNCNPNNLITLCSSCHSKTNFNRKYWIVYFKRFKF